MKRETLDKYHRETDRATGNFRLTAIFARRGTSVGCSAISDPGLQKFISSADFRPPAIAQSGLLGGAQSNERGDAANGKADMY